MLTVGLSKCIVNCISKGIIKIRIMQYMYCIQYTNLTCQKQKNTELYKKNWTTSNYKRLLSYYKCSGISTNDVSIWKSLVFNDKELIVNVEGGTDVLDLQCVNGKNDPMLGEVHTSCVDLEFLTLLFIIVLTAISS